MTLEISKDTAPERLSGYFYKTPNGERKEIVLGKRRGRPVTKRNTTWFSQDDKVDACTLYAVYGDVTEVSKLTKIPEATIRSWRTEPWWIEITKQVYIESNDGLTAKISHTLDKTLEHLGDRLEHGDYIWNAKSEQLVRKPVDTKVLAILFDNLAVQRRLGRGEATSIKGTSTSVDDRLTQLSTAFEKFAKMKVIEGTAEEEN